MGVHDGMCIAQGRCKPEFLENLTPPPCKQSSQNGDGGFGDLEPGLSRAGGGVTLPLHPPLSTTRAGNPKGSHGLAPFPSIWVPEYTGLRISTPKKAQFLFLQRHSNQPPPQIMWEASHPN